MRRLQKGKEIMMYDYESEKPQVGFSWFWFFVLMAICSPWFVGAWTILMWLIGE